MKKTLLSALKHSSGILLTIFALLCSCQVWADDAGGKTLYLIPNSTWKGGSSEYCLYYFNSTDNSKCGWVSMTEIGSGSGVYEASVPDGEDDWDRLIFVCKDPGKSGCNWDAKMYQTVNLTYSNSSNTFEITGFSSNYTGSWCNARRYSSGERIYLLNTTAYYLNGNPGVSNQMWYINDLAGHGGTAWIHLWCGSGDNVAKNIKFALLSGEAESDGAIYYAEVGEGLYSSFLITRNCSGSTGPWAPDNCIWNQSADFNIPSVNNRITGTTSSSYSSDYYTPCTNPTVSTTENPSTTAVSATCAGSYSYGGDYCEPASAGIAYKTAGGEYADEEGLAEEGTITASLTGLVPGTTYTYKAYVVLDNSIRIEGSEQTFTTGCPTITITGQPSESPVSYCSGAAISALSVTATSSPDYTMEYQWYSSSDKSSDSTISGATESSYTPSSGTLYYRCKVRTNSACDASAQTSNYSGLITFDPSRVSPIITASATSVTNYAPVTLTVAGADVTTWSVSGGDADDRYLYKESGKGAMFKGTVGSDPDVVYTVTGTTANDCSSAVNITVSSNTHQCR